MLFRKKRKLEEVKEITGAIDVSDLKEEPKTGLIKTDFETKDVGGGMLLKTAKTDLDDEILKKLEKLAFSIFIGAKNDELREKALSLFGRIKIVQAVKGTDKEDLIKFYTETGVSNDLVERLKSEGLLEVIYKVPGIEIKAKDREEIVKKIEEILKEEYDLKEEVKMALSGKPLKVNEENSELMGRLYELGFFEIYMVPKNWFDIPNVNGVNVERAIEEFKELKEGLPKHISRFLNEGF